MLMAVDTEDDSKGKVTLLNFFDGKTHETFEKQKDALKYVSTLKEVTIWACNLGYDINNLFKGSYNILNIAYANSRILCADIDGTNISFMDTLNHWQMSVEDMGERIGLKKIKELDVNNMKLMTARCKRDTEIVYYFVESMTNVYNKIGCRLKKTIASTSLDYFQRKFFGGRVTTTLTRSQIDFLHRGYYGGRTEVFFNKPVEGLIFYHDINSLYPASQLNKFPNLFEHYETKKPKFDKYEGAAEITVQAPEKLNIPYLPHKFDNKLIFPLGKWRGVYTYFEIREAVKLGYTVKKVHRAIEFYSCIRPFDIFVKTLYAQRQKYKKDWLVQTSFKNLLNHGYGKYGQKNEFTSFVPLHKVDMNILEQKIQIYGNMALIKKKEEYPPHANCIWAMYVTSYARHTLYKSLVEVEKQDGLLLYCDTDSIIYENKKQILANTTALGEFKLEGIYKYAWFKLPKLYKLIEYDSKKISYKAKGIPYRNDHQKEYFEKGLTRFQRPFKLREVLRRNLSPKRKVKLETNFWEWHEKEFKQQYNKRKVLTDGNTIPHVVSNEAGLARSRRKSTGVEIGS